MGELVNLPTIIHVGDAGHVAWGEQVGAVLNKATSAATPSTIVARDATGRIRFADPVDAADAVTKLYVDRAVAGLTPPLVATNDGVMTAIAEDSSSAFFQWQGAKFVPGVVVAPGVSGVVGDGATDDTSAIQAIINAAIAAGESRVFLGYNKTYATSAPLELSGTSTAAVRTSVTLIGPATIKPLAAFAGEDVVRHSQTSGQASAGSFGYSAGLQGIEIDGSALTAANVNGIRFDGAFQPVLSGLHVHNLTGHGLALLADNTIDSISDDTYACPGMTIASSKFESNTGWGIYESRFAADFDATSVYVNNNVAGGVRITSSNVTWDGGAIAYNTGTGLYFTKSTSAVTSTLSNAHFRSVEIDRNSGLNIWFENAFNCIIELPRLISAESGASFNGGVYITPVLVRFGGTAGMSAFNIRIVRPYVRASQQTTNPPITFYDFTSQSNDCEVTGMQELSGSSTARVIATTGGVRQKVTSSTGAALVTVTGDQANGVALAQLTAATTVSTALTDVVFDSVVTNALSRYNNTTGVYACGSDAGLYMVRGFLTVASSAATTDRTITVHLREDPGTGSFVSQKVLTVQVSGFTTPTDQVIPFAFNVLVSAVNTNLKIAAVASTGTALHVGSQYSELSVFKIS